MILTLILLIIGFVLLIKGAQYLVGGASSIARQKGISNLVIGLTVVAFGTSMPEMTVSLVAALEGRNDASFGNVIGSNNFNLFFILGLTGLIYPLAVHRDTVSKEIPMSLGLACLLLVLVNDSWLGFGPAGRDILSRMDALILLLTFAGFLYYIYINTKKNPETEVTVEVRPYSVPKSVGFILLGLAGLIGGGKLVVDSAVIIAQSLGLSERIIGLTILAIGTSLPELVTSAVAAWRKHDDIAIGNVVGSNIFNISLILGMTGMIHPISYNTSMNRDILLLICGTIALIFFLFIFTRHKLERWKAFLMLATYIGYTVYLVREG